MASRAPVSVSSPAPDSTYWSIGPTVTWNVFNANQLVNEVRVSNALQQQALLTYKSTVLQSFSDVEDALVAYAQDQNRTKVLTDAVSANQRSVDLSQQLYSRGLGDFLSVLVAQRSLYAVQLELASSQTNVSTDLVQLYKALGGGWDPNNEEQFHKNEDPAPEDRDGLKMTIRIKPDFGLQISRFSPRLPQSACSLAH